MVFGRDIASLPGSSVDSSATVAEASQLLVGIQGMLLKAQAAGIGSGSAGLRLLLTFFFRLFLGLRVCFSPELSLSLDERGGMST